MHTHRGFTLIELLVVVAVLTLVSSIVFASLNNARAEARDAKRTSDMKALQVALQIFYNANFRYPSEADGACRHNTSFGDGGCMHALVEQGILTRLPSDPLPGNPYYYDNWCRGVSPSRNPQQYRAWVHGENDNNGLAGNWWLERTVGVTTCFDPS
jgi:type II secretion system protein G